MLPRAFRLRKPGKACHSCADFVHVTLCAESVHAQRVVGIHGTLTALCSKFRTYLLVPLPFHDRMCHGIARHRRIGLPHGDDEQPVTIEAISPLLFSPVPSTVP